MFHIPYTEQAVLLKSESGKNGCCSLSLRCDLKLGTDRDSKQCSVNVALLFIVFLYFEIDETMSSIYESKHGKVP